MEESNRIKNINEYYFVKKLNEVRRLDADGGNPVLNFGIGSPDMPPPSSVTNQLAKAAALDDANGYQPYRGIQALRQKWATWYQKHFSVELNPDSEILPLMGSKEGVMHISMAFVNPGDGVLVPDPGYSAYGKCAEIAGGEVIAYDLLPSLGWQPDLNALERLDLSKIKLMWVNYPNMPTGAVVDLTFFEKLAQFGAKHNILICHDNPYSLIQNPDPLSILQVDDPFPWVLELSSLSKNYNMAGWRMGVVCADKTIINSILKFKSNMDSGMYKPIQMAAIEALSVHKYWNDEVNLIYKERQEKGIELMRLLDCSVEIPKAGFFVWAKVPYGYSGEEYSDYILSTYRIFITPGIIFGKNGAQYVRLSLCSPLKKYEEAINRLSTSLK